MAKRISTVGAMVKFHMNHCHFLRESQEDSFWIWLIPLHHLGSPKKPWTSGPNKSKKETKHNFKSTKKVNSRILPKQKWEFQASKLLTCANPTAHHGTPRHPMAPRHSWRGVALAVPGAPPGTSAAPRWDLAPLRLAPVGWSPSHTWTSVTLGVGTCTE